MSRPLATPGQHHRPQLLAPVTLTSENLEITSNDAGRNGSKTCADSFSNMKHCVVQFFQHRLHPGFGQTSSYSQLAVPEHQESRFLDLPREVHDRIIFFLPLCSQLSLRLTCRNLYHSQTTGVPRLFELLSTSPCSRFHIMVWLKRDGLWRQPGALAACSRCYGIYKLKKSFSSNQKELPNELQVCCGCEGAVYLNPQHTMSFCDYKNILQYYRRPGNFSVHHPDQASEILRMLPEDHRRAFLCHTWTTSTVSDSSFVPAGLEPETYMRIENRSPRPVASPYEGVNFVGLLHWRHLFLRVKRTKLSIVTYYVIRLAQHGSCRFPLCPHHMSNEKAVCQILRSNQPGNIVCRYCTAVIMINTHTLYPQQYVSLCTVRHFGDGIAPDKAWLKNLDTHCTPTVHGDHEFD